MNSKKTNIFLISGIVLFIAVIAFSIFNRSVDDSQAAPQSQEESQYCQKYLEFDDQVAILEFTEQLIKLKEITHTNDFPSELDKQYQTIIDAYEEYLDGNEVLQDEQANRVAYEEIALHARDNCELYSRNR